jgi:peroxiredoxin
MVIQLPLLAESLTEKVGWELKDVGLCRAASCVPVRDSGQLVANGVIDVAELGRLLGRPVLIDARERLAALGEPRADRAQAAAGGIAPDFELPDLTGQAHRLSDWAGRRLLVLFASWCGCRHDLPGWQALQDELDRERQDLTIIGVALDNSAADIRPWVEGITLPVLLDRDHVVAELFSVSNVPTVIWIDGSDVILRPNSWTFGTDTSTGFTGVAPEIEPIRHWARTGRIPPGPPRAGSELADEEVEARLHFQLGAYLHERQRDTPARQHFARAIELAPFDFTVHRAAMPLQGEDPFGPPSLRALRPLGPSRPAVPRAHARIRESSTAPTHLSASSGQWDDANEHLDEHRILVHTGPDEPIVAAQLRHELEHILQWRSVPAGHSLLMLYDAVLVSLDAFVGEDRRGSAVLYNVIPFGHEGSRAAARGGGWSVARLSENWVVRGV